MNKFFLISGGILTSLLFFSCTAKKNTQPESEIYKRGKVVYLTYCISCHHTDPKLDGSLGPAIKGSSLELIKARVLEAKYPEGYKPKRETKLMVALPDLAPDLEALHAYLNDLK